MWNTNLNPEAVAPNFNVLIFDSSATFAVVDSVSQTVPEPLTILGTGTAIIFGTTFKRQLNKAKKKQS